MDSTIYNVLDGINSSAATKSETYWLTREGTIVATDFAKAIITGRHKADVIGKHFSLLYSKADSHSGQPAHDLSCALKNGTCMTSGVRLKKNRVRFPANIYFHVSEDKDEVAPVRMTIVKGDPVKTTKDMHLQLKSEYQALLHNPFVGIIKINATTFDIIVVNNKACEILGRCGDTNNGIKAFLSNAGLIEKLKKTFKADSCPVAIHAHVERGVGDMRWVAAHCAFTQESNSIQIVLIDITNERKRNLEFDVLQTHFEQFIYHASHNLRSPLTSLLGLLQLAKFNLTSPELVSNYLVMMTERIEYLDRLLLDLITVANNENLPIELSNICMDREIRAITEACASDHKSVSFRVIGDQEKEFVTDLERLKLILRHVISNAFKFRNPVLEKPHVDVWFEVTNELAIITVEDNGIGVPPQFQKKIFNLFFKATNSHAGSGLGLYIVRKTVEKIGGEIKMKSTLYTGSTFSITLPNRRSDLRPKTIL